MSPAAMAFSSGAGLSAKPGHAVLASLVIATIAAPPRSAKLLWLSSPWRGRNSPDVHLSTSRANVPIKNSTGSGERSAGIAGIATESHGIAEIGTQRFHNFPRLGGPRQRRGAALDDNQH